MVLIFVDPTTDNGFGYSQRSRCAQQSESFPKFDIDAHSQQRVKASGESCSAHGSDAAQASISSRCSEPHDAAQEDLDHCGSPGDALMPQHCAKTHHRPHGCCPPPYAYAPQPPPSLQQQEQQDFSYSHHHAYHYEGHAQAYDSSFYYHNARSARDSGFHIGAPDEAERRRRYLLAERYKTKICRNYMATGACPYQYRCMFAHGIHELRTTDMNVRDGLMTHEAIRSFQRAMTARNRGELVEMMNGGGGGAMQPHDVYAYSPYAPGHEAVDELHAARPRMTHTPYYNAIPPASALGAKERHATV